MFSIFQLSYLILHHFIHFHHFSPCVSSGQSWVTRLGLAASATPGRGFDVAICGELECGAEQLRGPGGEESNNPISLILNTPSETMVKSRESPNNWEHTMGVFKNVFNKGGMGWYLGIPGSQKIGRYKRLFWRLGRCFRGSGPPSFHMAMPCYKNIAPSWRILEDRSFPWEYGCTSPNIPIGSGWWFGFFFPHILGC